MSYMYEIERVRHVTYITLKVTILHLAIHIDHLIYSSKHPFSIQVFTVIMDSKLQMEW